MEIQAEPLDTTSAPVYLAPAPPAVPDALMDLLENAASQPPAPGPEIVPFAPAGNFVSFFGLRENPFADCVHPSFFFRTDGHADTFRSMMLAVEFRASLGMVT